MFGSSSRVCRNTQKQHENMKTTKAKTKADLLKTMLKPYVGVRQRPGGGKVTVAMSPRMVKTMPGRAWVLWDRMTFDHGSLSMLRAGDNTDTLRHDAWIELIEIKSDRTPEQVAAHRGGDGYVGNRIPLLGAPEDVTLPPSLVEAALALGWSPDPHAMDYIRNRYNEDPAKWADLYAATVKAYSHGAANVPGAPLPVPGSVGSDAGTVSMTPNEVDGVEESPIPEMPASAKARGTVPTQLAALLPMTVGHCGGEVVDFEALNAHKDLPENARIWLHLLRDGRVPQAGSTMCRLDHTEGGGLNTKNGYCCLGVLQRIFAERTGTAESLERGPDGVARASSGIALGGGGHGSFTNANAVEWAGLAEFMSRNGEVVGLNANLATMNDSGKHSFARIAETVEFLYLKKQASKTPVSV